jgi:hypothetical protein
VAGPDFRPNIAVPAGKFTEQPPVANQLLSNKSQAIPTIQALSIEAHLRQHLELWVSKASPDAYVHAELCDAKATDAPKSPWVRCISEAMPTKLRI